MPVIRAGEGSLKKSTSIFVAQDGKWRPEMAWPRRFPVLGATVCRASRVAVGRIRTDTALGVRWILPVPHLFKADLLTFWFAKLVHI